MLPLYQRTDIDRRVNLFRSFSHVSHIVNNNDSVAKASCLPLSFPFSVKKMNGSDPLKNKPFFLYCQNRKHTTKYPFQVLNVFFFFFVFYRSKQCIKGPALLRNERLSITPNVSVIIKPMSNYHLGQKRCVVLQLYLAPVPKLLNKSLKRMEHADAIALPVIMRAIGRKRVENIFQWKIESEWNFFYKFFFFSYIQYTKMIFKHQMYIGGAMQSTNMWVRPLWQKTWTLSAEGR